MTTTRASADPDWALPRTALHPSLSAPLLDTMTFLNEVTHRYPQAISFAPGRPYEGDFDVARVPGFIETYLDHLRGRGLSEERVRTALYQYGETAGQIRDIVARMLEVDEDMTVDPAAVVVTVGCQEAVLLTLRALFTGPDDVLLVDSPAYVGITGAASLLDIPVVPVPGTPNGPSLEGLERTVREIEASGRRARCLYVVPDCSNPTGVSMRREDRTALLDAAGRLGLLLLEDNPYGVFSSVRRPTLKSLDTERRVVYLGSFAKTAFPAPGRLRRRGPAGGERGRPAAGTARRGAGQGQEHGHRQHLQPEPGRRRRAAPPERRWTAVGQRDLRTPLPGHHEVPAGHPRRRTPARLTGDGRGALERPRRRLLPHPRRAVRGGRGRAGRLR
ncbi:aminotransferase class I/II-fold pyridoxal phosphate-dependent enzyme, partial [Streptomyces geysiriensis]|uniref:aminotransferase class I/II-fold pyridoxal phosphate-dependent enzyme n=1 Tax=Streptomyces geysiriensis TaxID=68207 RepID=UPI002176AD04